MLRWCWRRRVGRGGYEYCHWHGIASRNGNSHGYDWDFYSLKIYQSKYVRYPVYHASMVHPATSSTSVYSSSPKNTLTGSQLSPHTLKRSFRLFSLVISSSVNSQPLMSKLLSMRAGVTDLGITSQPCWIPQSNITCCAVLPLASAIDFSVGSLYSGELVLPRHE